jgi:hypothetical protein
MMGGGVWTTPACLGGHNGPVSDVEYVDGGTQPHLVRLATRCPGRSSVSQFFKRIAWEPALTRESGWSRGGEPSEGPASGQAHRASLTAWSKRE